MQHFSYHKKSLHRLNEARERYAWLFDDGISEDGVEVRYILLEYLRESYGYSWRLFKDTSWKPIPIEVNTRNIYWSISHSKEYIAYSVSDYRTGIDIAEYEERDLSLLDTHREIEYKLLGAKNWKNFYLLWTAKEALIKAHGDLLDDIPEMQLISVGEWGMNLFEFRGQSHTITSLHTEEAILSYI